MEISKIGFCLLSKNSKEIKTNKTGGTQLIWITVNGKTIKNTIDAIYGVKNI